MIDPPLTEMMSLRGRTAIVTGGGRGLGEAIALRLGEAGASVVVADISEESANGVAGRINDVGGRAVAVQANVADAASGERALQLAVDRFDGIDILVNNAGIYPPGAILDITEDTWDEVFDINVKGMFFWSQLAARHMVAAGSGGRIINLASVIAKRPSMYMATYAISKTAVEGITRSLALELGAHGILVNSIAPGLYKTPGILEISADVRADQVLPTSAKLDYVARAALFFASGLSDFVTGTSLVVDGGFLLCTSDQKVRAS